MNPYGRSKRYGVHVETIGGGRAGLFLSSKSGITAEGPEGWALVNTRGEVQFLAEDIDAGRYRRLPVDSTTGAFVLPREAL